MSEDLRRRLDSDDRGLYSQADVSQTSKVLKDTRFWGMIGSSFFYPKSFLSENMSVNAVLSSSKVSASREELIRKRELALADQSFRSRSSNLHKLLRRRFLRLSDGFRGASAKHARRGKIE